MAINLKKKQGKINKTNMKPVSFGDPQHISHKQEAQPPKRARPTVVFLDFLLMEDLKYICIL